jgi:hypothetical protein
MTMQSFGCYRLNHDNQNFLLDIKFCYYIIYITLQYSFYYLKIKKSFFMNIYYEPRF